MDSQHQNIYDASRIIPIKDIHFDILTNVIPQKSALSGTESINIEDLYGEKQEPARGVLVKSIYYPSSINGEVVCNFCGFREQYCPGEHYIFSQEPKC